MGAVRDILYACTHGIKYTPTSISRSEIIDNLGKIEEMILVYSSLMIYEWDHVIRAIHRRPMSMSSVTSAIENGDEKAMSAAMKIIHRFFLPSESVEPHLSLNQQLKSAHAELHDSERSYAIERWRKTPKERLQEDMERRKLYATPCDDEKMIHDDEDYIKLIADLESKEDPDTYSKDSIDARRKVAVFWATIMIRASDTMRRTVCEAAVRTCEDFFRLARTLPIPIPTETIVSIAMKKPFKMTENKDYATIREECCKLISALSTEADDDEWTRRGEGVCSADNNMKGGGAQKVKLMDRVKMSFDDVKSKIQSIPMKYAALADNVAHTQQDVDDIKQLKRQRAAFKQESEQRDIKRTIEELLVRIVVLTKMFPHFHVKLREMGTVRTSRFIIAALIDICGIFTANRIMFAIESMSISIAEEEKQTGGGDDADGEEEQSDVFPQIMVDITVGGSASRKYPDPDESKKKFEETLAEALKPEYDRGSFAYNGGEVAAQMIARCVYASAIEMLNQADGIHKHKPQPQPNQENQENQDKENA